MTDIVEATDEIFGYLKTIWDADAAMTGVTLFWDNVKTPTPGDDATKPAKPSAWARATLRHLASPIEGKGGATSKYLTEAILTVQIFTPYGDGSEQWRAIVKSLLAAFRDYTIAGQPIWFTNARALERGQDRVWFAVDFVSDVRYEERN